MTDIKDFIEELKTEANTHRRRKLQDRDRLFRDLFAFTARRINKEYDLIVLITENNLMLNCISPHLTENLSGCSVGTDFLANLQRRYPLALTSAPEGCRIVCCAADRSAELAGQLCQDLKQLLADIDSYCGKSQYILNCFNVLDNAICIFDSSAPALCQ